MYPSGVTCLPMYYCFRSLTLQNPTEGVDLTHTMHNHHLTKGWHHGIAGTISSLTCEKNLHDRTISLQYGVLSHKISLTIVSGVLVVQSLVSCVIFCGSFFDILSFLLAIIHCVPITDSYCLFDIFKLFLWLCSINKNRGCKSST